METSNYGYARLMLWVTFLSGFLNFIPGWLGLVPWQVVSLLLFWVYKSDDSYVDWHARELFRFSILTIIYVVLSLFIAGILVGFSTGANGTEGEEGRKMGMLMVLLSVLWFIYVFVMQIRQIMAAHKNKLFVYPFIFSPRRGKVLGV